MVKISRFSNGKEIAYICASDKEYIYQKNEFAYREIRKDEKTIKAK